MPGDRGSEIGDRSTTQRRNTRQGRGDDSSSKQLEEETGDLWHGWMGCSQSDSGLAEHKNKSIIYYTYILVGANTSSSSTKKSHSL